MFGKSYRTKMQVLLNLEDSINLVKIFGVDIFDTINLRNSDMNIVKKDIQPSYMQLDRFKTFIKEMKKYNKEYYGSVKFEFIIK